MALPGNFFDAFAEQRHPCVVVGPPGAGLKLAFHLRRASSCRQRFGNFPTTIQRIFVEIAAQSRHMGEQVFDLDLLHGLLSGYSGRNLASR